MPPSPPVFPQVLVFAASDPTGGAGIQADILTLASLGCHPLTAVTALTVQDTGGVHAVSATPADFLEDQARAYGYDTLRLETGILQPAAIRLYERVGYRRIECFGPYVGNEQSICFEKAL